MENETLKKIVARLWRKVKSNDNFINNLSRIKEWINEWYLFLAYQRFRIFHQGIRMLPYTKSLVVTEISMFLEYEVLLIQTKI